jgi:guanylate kinase
MSSSQERTSRGRLVVISGPSGTGKTSICDAILREVPNAIWSVSATTRPPRGNEAAGSSYEFLSREAFMERQARDAFLESAEYCGHWYGTPAAPVRDAIERGKTIIMEIDVQGGTQIARKVPESIRIFILPPDHDSLKARLAGRNTESRAHMMKRLAAADGEIAIARDSGCYQHFVTNDVLTDTVERVIKIIQGHTG